MRNPSVDARDAVVRVVYVWKLPMRNPSREWVQSQQGLATVWKLPMRNPSERWQSTWEETVQVWKLPMRNPSTCELPSSFVSLWRLEATYEESKLHREDHMTLVSTRFGSHL